MTAPDAQPDVAELRACPFCGGGDLTFWQPCSGGGYGVLCRSCHTTMDARVETQSEAIAAWNRRAPDPAIDALRAERDALRASVAELLAPLERASRELQADGRVLNEYAQAAFDRARTALENPHA